MSITEIQFDRINSSLISKNRVNDIAHRIYRYPARFSPDIANKLISEFTRPGDLILDPFVGSGTTVVEARLLGRRALGTDISQLATFIARTKSKGITGSDAKYLTKWYESVEISCSELERLSIEYEAHTTNLDGAATWRIRNIILNLLESLPVDGTAHQKSVMRLIVLKTAQWAIDGRKVFPTIDRVRSKFYIDAKQTIEDLKSYKDTINTSNKLSSGDTLPRSQIFNDSAVNAYKYIKRVSANPPKLILTSPPYPGVHVLYHRWQLMGGKETKLPFLIAGLDEAHHGIKHYTLGGRTEKGIDSYFESIENVFSNMANFLSSQTVVAQVVAFNNINEQLPRYLDAMRNSGYSEVEYKASENRMWRDVPNRKWHANIKGETHSSREVLLIHRRLSSKTKFN